MATKTENTDRGIASRIKKGAVNWIGNTWPSFLVLTGLLASWQIYAEYFNPRGDSFFPSPDFTYHQTLSYSDRLVEGMIITFTEAVGGLILAVILGVIAGLIFAKVFTLRQAYLPAVVFGYSIPHAIVAPLFIVWFGSSIYAISLFVSWFGFFPMLVNSMTGFSSVDKEFRYLGEVTGASDWQMLRHIEIWEALPSIVSGIKIAVNLSIVGAIIAEFIATTGGLGYNILWAFQTLQMGFMFGVLIVLMIFAIVLFKVVEYLLALVIPGPV